METNRQCTPQDGAPPRYAEFWMRAIAALIEALVFMAVSIPVAFLMPLLVSHVDASIVLPQVPGVFFFEGLLPGALIASFLKSLLEYVSSHGKSSTTLIWALTIGGLVFLNLFYHVIMESSPLQATVGKLVVGMKVTTIEGKRPTFFAALLRHLSRLVSMALLFVGYAMVFKSAKRQALHDKISRCLVITS